MSATIYRHLKGVSQRLIVDLWCHAPSKNTTRGHVYKMPVLIDTGAVKSCIDKMLVRATGMTPCGRSTVCPTNGHEDEVDVYRVDFAFDKEHVFENVEVLELQLTDAYAIIGMDILSHCELHITHPEGNTQVAFVFD